MAKKRHTPEQVINKLREAEVAIAEGSTVAEAARRIGVTEQTFYRWHNGLGRFRAREQRNIETSSRGSFEGGAEPPKARQGELNLSISRKIELQSAAAESYNQPMAGDTLYPRFAEKRLTEALEDSPAVLVEGPRQCGKTTFAQMVRTSENLAGGGHPSGTLPDRPADYTHCTAATRFHYSPAVYPVATAALRADRLLSGSGYRHQWARWINEQAREALGKDAPQFALHTNAQRLLRL